MAERRYVSKAVRVADVLQRQIADGLWERGSMLPPETQLAEQFGASRVTLRRALDLVAERGLAKRIPYRGVMVSGDGGAAARASQEHGAGVSPRRRLTLGAIVASKPDEGLVLIQEGVERYTREHSLGLRFIATEADGNDAFAALKDVGHLGADGVILLPYPGPEPVDLLTDLQEQGFPLVCVERRSDRVPVPSVEPDNASGMYRAVIYLIQTYRRPVYFLGLQFDHRNDAQRYHGYVCAMQDAGFQELVESHTFLHHLHTADPRYWQEKRKWLYGYEVASRLFAEITPPVSVACLKDYIAWGTYKAAEEAGLTVGQDIAVTGFDDLTIARLLTPPLTTIRQDLREKGYQAAQLLHQRISKGHHQPVTVTVPVKLIVRGSA